MKLNPIWTDLWEFNNSHSYSFFIISTFENIDFKLQFEITYFLNKSDLFIFILSQV